MRLLDQHQARQVGDWNILRVRIAAIGVDLPAGRGDHAVNIHAHGLHGWPGLKGESALFTFQHLAAQLGVAKR